MKRLMYPPQTLRRWERAGRGIAVQRTAAGQRRRDISKCALNKPQIGPVDGFTLGYARVSSRDQK
jgi:predicted site-specific integrase-resolvase